MFARVTAVILLVLVFVRPPALARPLTEILNTERFRIHYTSRDRFAAERVARAAEESLTRISHNLGYQGAHAIIPIHIYPSHRDFASATGVERGKFVIGRAHAHSEHIELDSQEIFGQLETVTAHEVAHIVVFRIVGTEADVPLWAHEGIARTEAGEWDELDAKLLAEAAGTGRLMKLSEIARSFPQDREALAYAQSTSYMMYFLDTYGREALRQALARTPETGSFADAMLLVTGAKADEIENDWIAHLEKHYAPYAWMRLVSTIAIGALPIVLVLAYLGARRRKRALIEKYEQEEWEEANRRDWGNQWPGGGLQ